MPVDLDFVDRHTTGYETWRDHLSHLDRDAVLRATGLPAQIERMAELFAASDRTVICWAMGVTQHRNAVATIKEITNVALLQGNIGKPGAGCARCTGTPTCRATARLRWRCPVRLGPRGPQQRPAETPQLIVGPAALVAEVVGRRIPQPRGAAATSRTASPGRSCAARSQPDAVSTPTTG